MRILLVESEHPKTWGKYNQYHGLLKIGAYHKDQGDDVDYVVGKSIAMSGIFDQKSYDKIYIASLFSYWEDYYIDTIKHYREIQSNSEIIFGGIHAINAEKRIRKWEKKYGITVNPRFLDAVDYIPDVTLIDTDFASLLTSRGCPNNCTYCSVSNVYGKDWIPRSLKDVKKEIIVQLNRGIRHFALYDDNFFNKAKDHAIPFMKMLIKLKATKKYKSIKFSIPSGFQASHMTEEIAKLMWKANFRGRIAIGLESVDTNVLKKMGRGKWSKEEPVKRCVDIMKSVGYHSRDINVFFMCGLPYQTVDNMLDTAMYIGSLGCYANMQRFAPIPGTKDFERCGLDVMEIDMKETEGNVFLSPQDNFTDQDIKDITMYVRWQNSPLLYCGYHGLNVFDKQSSVLEKAFNKVADKIKEKSSKRRKLKH